jgi:myo-inositol-1(or 4)-monophosphatase
LYEEKKPIVALIMEVAKSELFTAVKGKGAYLNGRPIQVSSISEAGQSLLATGFPYRDLGLLDEYLNLFKTFIQQTHGVRRPGSAAYDLACVAAGRFEAFYEYGLSPWDVAAGILLVQEAGGVVTDWTGNDDYVFGKRIVAGNEAVHAYVLEQINLHFKPEQLT